MPRFACNPQHLYATIKVVSLSDRNGSGGAMSIDDEERRRRTVAAGLKRLRLQCEADPGLRYLHYLISIAEHEANVERDRHYIAVARNVAA